MLKLYCYSTSLTQTVPGGIVTSGTLGFSHCVSEDEARGKAVAFARKEKPEFSIAQVLVMEIPQPQESE